MRASEGFTEAPGGGMIVLPNPVTIGGRAAIIARWPAMLLARADEVIA
jgi:hypothetical protein